VYVTNLTSSDIYFGPLHLPASAANFYVDDTTATSLYLTSDAVADAINNAAQNNQITVTGAADPFPRPTGEPKLLHGTGNPEGIVYAPQGSVYMRRDGADSNGGVIYSKTTGVTYATGWVDIATASGASVASPTGAIFAYGGPTPPSGWLICDGSAVSRTTYSLLFAVVGTAYGAGDGSTTFNLPDMRGRVGLGYAASGGHSDASALGNNDGSALAYRRSKHRHTPHSHVTSGRGSNSWVNDQGYFLFGDPSGSYPGSLGTSTVDGGSGNSTDPLDGPAYLVINHIIKT
jgi:microcystin-dependent protein